MWLPKDERRFLAYYFRELRKSNEKKPFPRHELMKVLNKDKNINKSGQEKTGDVFDRVEIANLDLKERGYIHVNFETIEYSVALTLKGCDLGRKYKSKLISSGLWFKEYKDHWIWLIVGFLGGIVGALLVNFLSKGD